MFLTDYLILLIIIVLLLWGIHDEGITARWHGPVQLKVVLQRRHSVDALIFIGLVAILIYNNISHQGPRITTALLLTLIFIIVWLFWIHSPKLLLKKQGFFFAGLWHPYENISSMNLSEDGILMIQLEQRHLLIRVRDLDDLEKIYLTMAANQ